MTVSAPVGEYWQNSHYHYNYPYMNLPVYPQRGWQCPVCRSVYSPDVAKCWTCPADNNVFTQFKIYAGESEKEDECGNTDDIQV
jgi:uncharacterized OB-fold protein